MKKFKSFSIKSMASLSREEMARISGGSDDRYYTSCTMDNVGDYCVYGGKSGVAIIMKPEILPVKCCTMTHFVKSNRFSLS